MYVTIPATSNCATSTCNAEIAATGIDSLTAIAVGGLVLALGIILVARRQVMT